MATGDQKKRLEELWKTADKAVRGDLEDLYNTGACECEINVSEISKQFNDQWVHTNKAAAPEEVRKLFISLARDIKKEWVNKVSTGTLTNSGSTVKVTRNGSSGQVLNFTMEKGESGRKGKKAQGASNNFKIFKEVNAKIFQGLAKSSTYKSLFTGYSKKKSGGLRSPIDIGHVKALGSAGRASAAAGIIEGVLELDQLSPAVKADFIKTRDSLLTLGLSDTSKQVVKYSNGELKFIGTQQYTLETSKKNKGDKKKDDDDKEAEVVKTLNDLLESLAPSAKDFVNQTGSPSMVNIVGDMIVNTPLKKRAYKKKRAKNLSKYKKPIKARSGSRTASKEEKYKGSNGKASFGLDSAMAAGLPKSARPGKQTEGGSGQTPEDFAQKIRGLLKVKRAINQRLPAEVRRNMGSASTLNNRTGRFSNSAEVTQILPAAQTLMVKYSYRLDPYETFENRGKRRWPAGYNPKPLIAKSIRGLALGLVDEKLTIRRE